MGKEMRTMTNSIMFLVKRCWIVLTLSLSARILLGFTLWVRRRRNFTQADQIYPHLLVRVGKVQFWEFFGLPGLLGGPTGIFDCVELVPLGEFSEKFGWCFNGGD